jgi:hypothetical protein
MRLNQRARPPGTPLGVVVVAVTAIRSMPLIIANIASGPRRVKTRAIKAAPA